MFLRPGLTSPTMRKAPSGTATGTRVEKQHQQLDNIAPSRSVTLAQMHAILSAPADSLAAAGLASCENVRASPELLAHTAPAATSRRCHTDVTAASRTLRRAESVEELRAALSTTNERSHTPTPLNWPPTHSRSLPRLAVGLGASPTVSRAPSSSPTVAPRRRSLGQRAEARRALQLGCGDGGEAAPRGMNGAVTALVASDEAVTPSPALP